MHDDDCGEFVPYQVLWSGEPANIVGPVVRTNALEFGYMENGQLPYRLLSIRVAEHAKALLFLNFMHDMNMTLMMM